MNRELKFRVWDKVKKEFINFNDSYWDENISLNNYGILNFGNRLIFQQFTGLKDKTGREIYEGDILKCTINAPHFPIEYKEVFFWDGSFKYRYQSKHWADTFIENLNEEKVNELQLEIVGNIFENPELIS